MKIKLTPKLAYVAGAWKHRRTKEGIGVAGSEEFAQSFAAALIDSGICSPDKIVAEDRKVFTYHTAYRAYLEDLLARQTDVFKHMNEFSASFYAGMYDSVGGEKAGRLFFAKADNSDEIALLRFNWKVTRVGRGIFVGPSDGFRAWMREYRRVELPAPQAQPTVQNEVRKIIRKPRRVYPTPPPR